ncbi:MAG: hemolysin III family protein [Elusimicrobia bacterium]|nr:hemolysin III family protein [Elusimicrobiota bacterium]
METFAGVPDPEYGHRHQTPGEELANSISHGAGALAGLAVLPVLIGSAMRRGADTRALTGLSVFGASVVLLYLGSTIYHALPHGRVKRFFRIAEHMAIYFLIAGSYTPFMLGVLRGALGTALLWTIWILTGIGVLFKIFGGTNFPRVSTWLYMLMGWASVIAIGQLWLRMPHAGFCWLVAGGIAYNIGVIFYVRDHHMRYGHFIWHLFVLAGTACHFCAVLWYSGL